LLLFSLIADNSKSFNLATLAMMIVDANQKLDLHVLLKCLVLLLFLWCEILY
jgi:hypothetical protein